MAEEKDDVTAEQAEETVEAPAVPEPEVETPEAEAPAEAESPVAEEEPTPQADAAASAAEKTAPVEETAPAPQSEPKKKRKRLPRAQRPVKTRPRRAASTGERKPIVREPKPEHPRGSRQERRGVVVSSSMDKTIVVKVDVITSHQRYKKVIRRSVKFHAHDEQNAAKVGDVVRIVETRPLSATKNWRLAEIVEVAK